MCRQKIRKAKPLVYEDFKVFVTEPIFMPANAIYLGNIVSKPVLKICKECRRNVVDSNEDTLCSTCKRFPVI